MKKMFSGLMLLAVFCGMLPPARAAETATRPGYKEITEFLGENNLASSYVNLQEGINIGKKVVNAVLPLLSANDQEKSQKITAIAHDFITRSGLEALLAKGTGVNRGADKIYTARCLAFAPAAAQKGFIWDGLATDPQARFQPQIFPADTEIAIAMNYHFDKIYQEALYLVTKHAPAKDAAKIKEAISELQTQGVDVAKLCADMQGINIFWAHSGNLDLANLRFGLIIRGGALAFKTLQTLVNQNSAKLSKKFPGMKVTPECLTFPLPSTMGKVDIFQSNGYLVATTIKSEIDALLAGKGKSLSTNPVFKATLGNLPATQTAFYSGKNNYAIIKTLLMLKQILITPDIEKLIKELGGDQPLFCGMGRNANGIFTVARSACPLAYCERLYGESKLVSAQLGFAAGIFAKSFKKLSKDKD